jgi:SAM-dependent methyltransferase
MLGKVLSHPFIWRASGAAYPLAVMATRGRLLTVSDYLTQSRSQMRNLPIDWRGSSALEFGCGIGGNLLALSDQLKMGVGVDVNPGFIRLARRIGWNSRASNVRFLVSGMKLDGEGIKFDKIFCLGVFERIPKEKVEAYVRELVSVAVQHGELALYFLSHSSKNTRFTDWLGVNAYVFWSRNEVMGLLQRAGCVVERIIEWPSPGHHVADVYVATKR